MGTIMVWNIEKLHSKWLSKLLIKFFVAYFNWNPLEQVYMYTYFGYTQTVFLTHIKISHFLPHKSFQRCGIGHLISIHTWILEVWSLLLWKFGLGSYSRFKIHWCLALRFAVNTTLTVKILALTNSALFFVLIHWTANRSAKHQWILDLE